MRHTTAPQIDTAMIAANRIGQPTSSGTPMRLQPVGDEAAKAAPVKPQMREEAGDQEEGRHAEDVQDVEEHRERQAAARGP